MDVLSDKKATWKFAPSRNRYGKTRSSYDLKHIICAKSDLFQEPTILTSDLHAHSHAVLEQLETNTNIKLKDYNVITAGDMAGDGIFGSDGDPTEFYIKLQKKCKSLLVVQGNHDLPTDTRNKKTHGFDSSCLLRNGEVRDTIYGKVGGVNGIISNKPHPYKIGRAHV